MRLEHLGPAQAHVAFHHRGARSAFGVHWSIFTLGQESTADTRTAFDAAARFGDDGHFRFVPIGDWMPVRALETPAP